MEDWLAHLGLKTLLLSPLASGGDFNEIFFHSEKLQNLKPPLTASERPSLIMVSKTLATWDTILRGATTKLAALWFRVLC